MPSPFFPNLTHLGTLLFPRFPLFLPLFLCLLVGLGFRLGLGLPLLALPFLLPLPLLTLCNALLFALLLRAEKYMVY